MSSIPDRYYLSIIDEQMSDILFVEDSRLLNTLEYLEKMEYKIINMTRYDLKSPPEYQERLIDATGYLENGARNPNVFYELISDLRWLDSKLLAIVVGRSDFIFRKEFSSTLNSMAEGSARLKIEQNRHLLKIFELR
jgi:hypothetical protein